MQRRLFTWNTVEDLAQREELLRRGLCWMSGEQHQCRSLHRTSSFPRRVTGDKQSPRPLFPSCPAGEGSPQR